MGVVVITSPELSLIQVSRVSDRTVLTELARRNNGFTLGKRSQLGLRQVSGVITLLMMVVLGKSLNLRLSGKNVFWNLRSPDFQLMN